MKFADAALNFWGARTSKERSMLCAAGVTLFAAAAYVFFLEPALAASRQLSAALPRLRAHAEDMRLQQKEIAALRKKVAAAARHTDLRALLQSSAARTSFVNSIERVDSISGDRALFIAAPILFDDWLGWIENLQREFGIRLDGCKISATDQPGLVRVEATFASAGRPAIRKTQ